MPARAPDDISRPHVRLGGTFAVGTATSNGGVINKIIPVRGSARVRVRIKTATNGGTIDLLFVGPDYDVDALTGTVYTTGNPTQVAVTAGTEATIASDCYGESYALVRFTGTVGAGTITYVDVAQV